MGKYEQALADLDRAIELKPDDEWALSRRGVTYQQVGKYEQALAEFNRKIELDVDDDWALYSRYLTFLAQNQGQQGKLDLERAIGIAQGLLQTNPNDWRIGLNLALYLLASGAEQAAETLYQQAVDAGAPAERIRDGINDLEEFLHVQPDHQQAENMLALLRQALQTDQ